MVAVTETEEDLHIEAPHIAIAEEVVDIIEEVAQSMLIN